MKVKFRKPRGQRIKKAQPILIRNKWYDHTITISILSNFDNTFPEWYSHEYKKWISSADLMDYLKKVLDNSVSNEVGYEAKIRSLKAAKRFIFKTPHPKGSKFRVSLPWCGHSMVITK